MNQRMMVVLAFAAFLSIGASLLSGVSVQPCYSSSSDGTDSSSPPAPSAVEEPPSPPQPMAPPGEFKAPPLQMVAPGVYEFGGIRILKREGRVEFPSTVNMDRGLLEYLLVGQSGKLHESLLRTNVEPYCLQIALLLLGLEGTTNPLSGQGDPRKPEGDPVSIWIEVKEKDKIRKLRVEEWVVNIQDKSPLKPMEWVFTGSTIVDGVFMAQVDRSIIAIFHDPAAIIDNPLSGGDNDKIWHVNEGHVPPPGTDVTVILQKESRK